MLNLKIISFYISSHLLKKLILGLVILNPISQWDLIIMFLE